MSGKLKRAKNRIELIVREAFGNPIDFCFLDKDINGGSYLLNGRVIKAIQVGLPREIRLSLRHEETMREIREAMTKAALSEPEFNANAVYIMKKNGVMRYCEGGDVTKYQPLRININDISQQKHLKDNYSP